MDWRKQAACLGLDPNLFFGDRVDTWQAQAVCATCPVRAECLQDQLAWEAVNCTDGHVIPSGVFGGVPPTNRRALLRNYPKIGCVQ